jgi:hypothetical protein
LPAPKKLMLRHVTSENAEDEVWTADCKTLLPLQGELCLAASSDDVWRCNFCECSDVSDENGQWILCQLSFVKQEGTSDIGPERMLTLIMNRGVLNRTPEQNIEWLNLFFLLRWLDGVNDYLPHWRISKTRGLQLLGDE